MRKITKIQLVTILLAIAWIPWELYIREWSKTQVGGIIRIDLLFIYPIMLVMVTLSVFQLFRKKKNEV
ncbi:MULTISPECIES: hypothetical protein [Planococcus]|uniref:Uncharacterized protein n=1 Tax=Planococcus versutus TaxID=1302659 RepID=A0A1B1S5W1_9BACL|nr:MULTISPECIES: hypothetical protein [Planococcus]ANU28561.1 hypothetical protein I858_016395 [Planococcus versutus]OHX51619.1 hypothetical protein BB777_15710 [Planococcus faecalis]OHX51677.1 hypothetical protein BB777_16025 [Planococcus faecalis]